MSLCSLSVIWIMRKVSCIWFREPYAWRFITNFSSPRLSMVRNGDLRSIVTTSHEHVGIDFDWHVYISSEYWWWGSGILWCGMTDAWRFLGFFFGNEPFWCYYMYVLCIVVLFIYLFTREGWGVEIKNLKYTHNCIYIYACTSRKSEFLTTTCNEGTKIEMMRRKGVY